jgi:hypothetical protein
MPGCFGFPSTPPRLPAADGLRAGLSTIAAPRLLVHHEANAAIAFPDAIDQRFFRARGFFDLTIRFSPR